MTVLRSFLDMIVDPHRNRVNPLVLGVIGIALVAAVLASAVALPRGWYLVRTDGYTAEFESAAGLSTSDPVYVAGVPAGRVESVDLAGDRVRVGFRLDRDQPLGDATAAAIKFRTVLGKLYLDVTPGGHGEVGEGYTIPLARTTVPYSLDEVATDTMRTASELDVPALEDMMSTLGDVLPDSDRTRAALTGVSAVAGTISRNGEQISQLLETSRSVSVLVAAQSDSLVALLDNARIVLGTVAERRDVLTKLSEDLRTLVDQASAFLVDNDDSLNQLITDLGSVLETLAGRAAEMDRLMTSLPPALRAATDASGNGTWMDVSAPAGPVPDNLLCALQVMQGCR
ncbi:MCE family protein [Rhodococcus sp. NPDC058521]|uniref:MCE family protein n=1 Tax=Rhodococcus sp. NPDC058521 TaxID=3346536 RepID=UPI00365A3224